MTFISLLVCSALLSATSLPDDSAMTINIDEVVVKTTSKQTSLLRNTATSVSHIDKETIDNRHIEELGDLNALVPNFFMPKYGSKLSSALYIRGIGSRINTPAVALYVDDVPVAEKSEYTFNLFSIDHIDVLRGPQGTLYGRNAMGGILRLYTRNPFYRQGTDINISGATRNELFKVSATTNQKISDKLAFSLGGFYETNKGFFHNDSLNRKVGGNDAFGINTKLIFHPSQNWFLDWNANYEYSDEDGYPYFYGGQLTGTEIPNALDRITSNRQSSYRRSLFSTNFKAVWEGQPFILSSVTSFRNLSDRMFMDQDFTYKDFFSMEQRQKSNTVSEEFTLKSKPFKRWEWTGGLFALYQAIRTQSPVTFHTDGVDMINSSIASNMPTPTVTVTNPYTGQPATSAMPMAMSITDPTFTAQSRFRNPVVNGALFLQATLHDFITDGLGLTLGLRLDNEHQELRYVGCAPANFNFKMPSHNINKDFFSSEILSGKIKNDKTSLLPKIALQYDFNNKLGNVYLSVAKGQRAGGYNIQMFSDILSSVMQNDMMIQTKDYLDQTMDEHAQQMPAMASMFLSIKDAIDQNIPIANLPEVKNTITYKPEQCWNYEVGTHLNLLDNKLMADLSIFFMDIRHQQISRMVSSGFGRIMVNAGESHSCGLELSLRGKLLQDRLAWHANYGYTHSEFYNYNIGTTDYTGNTVPFIPEHNALLAADYNIISNGSNSLLKNIILGVQGNGLGRIYWNEENTARQNFYCTLKAHVLFDFGQWSVNIWGDNLTCTKYNAFYFESSQRKYYQKGTPFQLGVDLHWKF